MKKFRTGVLAGAGVFAAVTVAQSAQAATVYSTGFETTEGFTNGNLVGQTGGTPAYTFAQSLATPSDITAAVNSGKVVLTATNLSANVSGVGDAASFYPAIADGTVNTTATPIVTISGQLAVTSTADTPGFGFSVFSSTTPTTTPIFSVYEEGDGTLIYQGSGAAVNPSTPALTLGTPSAFSVTLNYVTGTFGLSAGGSFFTGSFNDTLGFKTVGLSAATFDNTAGSTGTGTFDNFSITSSVPEPATGSIVLGGLAVGGLRRRRRNVSR